MNTDNKKRVTLYEYTVCPFCHKVKALMLYKKIPFQSIEVNPMNQEQIQFSKDYKKVPIVVDQYGIQVNDSTPIMRHLDKLFPESQAFETASDRVEKENAWLKWADDRLVKALPPLIYDTLGHSIKAFDYITKSGNFSWWQRLSIKYSGAFVMWMVAKKSAKKQNITNPSEHLNGVLNEFVDGLNSRDFLGDDKPNGADLAVYGILHSIAELPGFEIVKSKPTIYEWYCRVSKRLK